MTITFQRLKTSIIVKKSLLDKLEIECDKFDEAVNLTLVDSVLLHREHVRLKGNLEVENHSENQQCEALKTFYWNGYVSRSRL